MEKIGENRKPRALFSSESRVSMRGQVYAFLGGLVWDMFWISQRESEVIAPKRRREGERELGTERVPADVSPKVDFVH